MSFDKNVTKPIAIDKKKKERKKIRTTNKMFRNRGGIRFGGIWAGTILPKQTESLKSHSVPEPSDKFLFLHDLTSLRR